MTVQEATKRLNILKALLWTDADKKNKHSIDLAIQALEEVEQYRALGTPKEIKIREVSSAQLGKAYLSNLTELREYQSLGTVEELKEARKKQVAKKPIIWENKSIDSPIPNDDWGYECPCCGNRDIDYPEHHCECGQALKWSEEDD